MSAFIEWPLKHSEDNIIFGVDGTKTAYFEIPGFGYDFLDDEAKFEPFFQQLHFLSNRKGRDLHYLAVPHSEDVGQIAEIQKKRMEMKSRYYDYDLLENGQELVDKIRQFLQMERKRYEKREYRMYIGVQLDPKANRYKPGNKGTRFFSTLQEFLSGLTSDVNRVIGMESGDILRSEIEAYQVQAEEVKKELQSAYRSMSYGVNEQVRSISTEEVIQLIEIMYSATTSFRDVSLREQFTTGEIVKAHLDNEEIEVIRPNEKGFLDLQGSYIEEVDPDTLRISKEVEGRKSTIYSRNLVVTNFHQDAYSFPGWEWFHKLVKNLPFPVTTSMRMHYKDNERTIKELGNAKLEFEDQRDQASKANTQVDRRVSRNEASVHDLEDYFQSSGYPGYENSFVFRITAETMEALNDRSALLKEALSRYGIQSASPYGLQPELFMEMIPGSRQYNQDYVNETDPKALASMMFGAYSSIGDRSGFYLGETRQGKPVHIFPELGSKDIKGMDTLFHSISCLIAGATGFGKSMLMNLFTYHSVLAGAYALIIDPKGDRRKWAEDGLPYIPKEHISLWVLGESSNDKGALDPFRTSPTVDEGKDVAINIMAYLLNAKIDDVRYSFLTEAFSYAAKQEDPCVGHGIQYLRSLYESPPEKMGQDRYESLDNMLATMKSFTDQAISAMLIGEPGQNYKTLNLDQPLQILSIERLGLPKAHKDPENYSVKEKVATAIMISITSYSQQFMKRGEGTFEGKRHKVIAQDESSFIDKNESGRELMDYIARQGRTFTTTLLKGSQNASDHGDDIAHMGMKFCFSLKTTDEAEQMLGYFNLPVTRENVQTLKNLRKGQCLFQDIQGRTDIINVNPVFEQIFDAFRTDTNLDDEEDFETEIFEQQNNSYRKPETVSG